MPELKSCEAIFAEVGGRPHWGKLHSLGIERIEEIYPRYQDFVARRRQLDPEGRFLNGYLRERFL